MYQVTIQSHSQLVNNRVYFLPFKFLIPRFLGRLMKRFPKSVPMPHPETSGSLYDSVWDWHCKETEYSTAFTVYVEKINLL